MCDKAKFLEMDGEVDALNQRVSALEDRVEQLHEDTKSGFVSVNSSFAAVNSNIETVSQQVVTLGNQLTNLGKQAIEERAHWGGIFRSIVQWSVRTALLIIAYAAGVNLTKTLLESIWGGN